MKDPSDFLSVTEDNEVMCRHSTKEKKKNNTNTNPCLCFMVFYVDAALSNYMPDYGCVPAVPEMFFTLKFWVILICVNNDTALCSMCSGDLRYSL